jgi:hypothetical protein
MSRKLRIEYPGATYHVMNRGDQREDIFRDDDDRRRLLSTLEGACAKTEWQIHAYSSTMSLKWIAQRLHMGSWTYVSNLLNEQSQPQPQGQELLPLCQ